MVQTRQEGEVRVWIEITLGRKLPGPLAESLHDSVVLCELMNKLFPNTIAEYHYDHDSIPDFLAMENINMFVEACRERGVPESSLFHTIDLFERKNMQQVFTCLLHLKEASLNGFSKNMDGVEGYKVVGGREDLSKHKAEVTYWGRVVRFFSRFPFTDWIILPLVSGTAVGFGIKLGCKTFNSTILQPNSKN